MAVSGGLKAPQNLEEIYRKKNKYLFLWHIEVLAELQQMNTNAYTIRSSWVVWLLSCFYIKRLELTRDLIKI